MSGNRHQNSNKKYVIVAEDWLNANLSGGINSLSTAEDKIKKDKRVYYYRCMLFLLFLMMAVPLNLIFFAWVYCTEDTFRYAMYVQFFVFFLLARKWDIDKEIISTASSIYTFFRSFII